MACFSENTISNSQYIKDKLSIDQKKELAEAMNKTKQRSFNQLYESDFLDYDVLEFIGIPCGGPFEQHIYYMKKEGGQYKIFKNPPLSESRKELSEEELSKKGYTKCLLPINSTIINDKSKDEFTVFGRQEIITNPNMIIATEDFIKEFKSKKLSKEKQKQRRLAYNRKMQNVAINQYLSGYADLIRDDSEYLEGLNKKYSDMVDHLKFLNSEIYDVVTGKAVSLNSSIVLEFLTNNEEYSLSEKIEAIEYLSSEFIKFLQIDFNLSKLNIPLNQFLKTKHPKNPNITYEQNIWAKCLTKVMRVDKNSNDKIVKYCNIIEENTVIARYLLQHNLRAKKIPISLTDSIKLFNIGNTAEEERIKSDQSLEESYDRDRAERSPEDNFSDSVNLMLSLIKDPTSKKPYDVYIPKSTVTDFLKDLFYNCETAQDIKDRIDSYVPLNAKESAIIFYIKKEIFPEGSLKFTNLKVRNTFLSAYTSKYRIRYTVRTRHRNIRILNKKKRNKEDINENINSSYPDLLRDLDRVLNYKDEDDQRNPAIINIIYNFSSTADAQEILKKIQTILDNIEDESKVSLSKKYPILATTILHAISAIYPERQNYKKDALGNAFRKIITQEFYELSTGSKATNFVARKNKRGENSNLSCTVQAGYFPQLLSRLQNIGRKFKEGKISKEDANNEIIKEFKRATGLNINSKEAPSFPLCNDILTNINNNNASLLSEDTLYMFRFLGDDNGKPWEDFTEDEHFDLIMSNITFAEGATVHIGTEDSFNPEVNRYNLARFPMFILGDSNHAMFHSGILIKDINNLTNRLYNLQRLYNKKREQIEDINKQLGDYAKIKINDNSFLSKDIILDEKTKTLSIDKNSALYQDIKQFKDKAYVWLSNSSHFKDKEDAELKDLAEQYAYNYVYQMATQILLNGDSLFLYPSTEEFQKRYKQTIATGEPIDITAKYRKSDGSIDFAFPTTNVGGREVVKDEERHIEITEVEENYFYFEAKAENTGLLYNLFRTYGQLENTLTIEQINTLLEGCEVEIKDGDLIKKMNLLEAITNVRMLDKTSLSNILKALSTLEYDNKPVFLESDVYTIFKSYLKISTSDGQSYRSFDSYFSMMVGSGQDSPELIQFKEDLDAYRKLSEDAKKGGIGKALLNKLRNSKVYLQPIKPFKFTMEEIEIEDSKGDKTFLGSVPYQYKCAEVVIVPELMPECGLRTLGEFMRDNDIQVAVGTSGVKVGSFGHVDISNCESKEVLEENLKKAYVHKTRIRDYHIQNKNYYHANTEKTQGVQSRKIIPAGIDTTGEKEYKYFEETSFRLDNKTTGEPAYADINKGEGLLQMYYSLIAANISEAAKEVFGDLKDGEKLCRKIADSIIASGEFSLDDLVYLSIDPEYKKGELAKFFAPLIHVGKSKEAIELLISRFRSKVVTQTAAGGSAVQQASWGTRGFGSSGELNVIYNDVKDENGNVIGKDIAYMECEMPFDFSINGMSLDYDSYVNEDGTLIKDEDTGEVLLERDFPGITEIIAYRIPTERGYSILPLKITRFTRPCLGGTIKLPAVGVAMAGFDFDIDKLHLMRRTYNYKYANVKMSNSGYTNVPFFTKVFDCLFPEFKEAEEKIEKETEGKIKEGKLLEEDILNNKKKKQTKLHKRREAVLRNFKSLGIPIKSLNNLDELFKYAHIPDVQKILKNWVAREKEALNNNNEISEKEKNSKLQKLSEIESNISQAVATPLKNIFIHSNMLEYMKNFYNESVGKDNTAEHVHIVKKSLSSYDWDKTPSENTKEDRQNLLFDFAWKRMQDPEIAESRTRPGGFEAPKDAAQLFRNIESFVTKNGDLYEVRFPGEKKDDGSKEEDKIEIFKTFEGAYECILKNYKKYDAFVTYSPTNVNTLLRFNQQNQVAGKCIGIAAIANSCMHLLSGINKFAVTIGKTKNSKGTLLVFWENLSDFWKKALAIAQILAASVDAVKAPALNYLNINTYTINYAIGLLLAGFSFREVGLILNNPKVKNAISKAKESESPFYRNYRSLGNKKYETVETLRSAIESNQAYLCQAIVDGANVKVEIGDKNINTEDIIDSALDIAYQYSSVFNDFSTVSKNTSPNTLPNSVGGFVLLVRKLTEALNRVKEYYPESKHFKESKVARYNPNEDISGGDSVYQTHPNEILSTNKDSDNILGYENFLGKTMQLYFMNILKIVGYNESFVTGIQKYTAGLYNIKDYHIDQILENMNVYEKMKNAQKIFDPLYLNDKDENGQRLINYDKYLNKSGGKIQKLIEWKQSFPENELARELKIEHLSNGDYIVDINTVLHKESEQTTVLKDRWRELLNNEETKELAIDLYYMAHFSKGGYALSNIAPIEIFTEHITIDGKKYIDFLDELQENTKEESANRVAFLKSIAFSKSNSEFVKQRIQLSNNNWVDVSFDPQELLNLNYNEEGIVAVSDAKMLELLKTNSNTDKFSWSEDNNPPKNILIKSVLDGDNEGVEVYAWRHSSENNLSPWLIYVRRPNGNFSTMDLNIINKKKSSLSSIKEAEEMIEDMTKNNKNKAAISRSAMKPFKARSIQFGNVFGIVFENIVKEVFNKINNELCKDSDNGYTTKDLRIYLNNNKSTLETIIDTQLISVKGYIKSFSDLDFSKENTGFDLISESNPVLKQIKKAIEKNIEDSKNIKADIDERNKDISKAIEQLSEDINNIKVKDVTDLIWEIIEVYAKNSTEIESIKITLNAEKLVAKLTDDSKRDLKQKYVSDPNSIQSSEIEEEQKLISDAIDKATLVQANPDVLVYYIDSENNIGIDIFDIKAISDSSGLSSNYNDQLQLYQDVIRASLSGDINELNINSKGFLYYDKGAKDENKVGKVISTYKSFYKLENEDPSKNKQNTSIFANSVVPNEHMALDEFGEREERKETNIGQQELQRIIDSMEEEEFDVMVQKCRDIFGENTPLDLSKKGIAKTLLDQEQALEGKFSIIKNEIAEKSLFCKVNNEQVEICK